MHPRVATHPRIPTPRKVKMLPTTATLPALARLPATATLPAVATLPATATEPAVATLPATATLLRVATLPATAVLLAVATLPATAVPDSVTRLLPDRKAVTKPPGRGAWLTDSLMGTPLLQQQRRWFLRVRLQSLDCIGLRIHEVDGLDVNQPDRLAEAAWVTDSVTAEQLALTGLMTRSLTSSYLL
jgi:hypothetical protein